MHNRIAVTNPHLRSVVITLFSRNVFSAAAFIVVFVLSIISPLQAQWTGNREKARQLIVDTRSPFNITTLENPKGGAYIVWKDIDDSLRTNVRFQSIDLSGRSLLAPAGKTIAENIDSASNVYASVSATGVLYFLWKEKIISTTGSQENLRLQRSQTDGAFFFPTEGMNAKVSEQTITDYSLTVDQRSNAFIPYIEKFGKVPADYSVHIQRITPQGKSDIPSARSLISSSARPKAHPIAVPDKRGGIFIFWLEGEPGGNKIVYAQYLDRLGNKTLKEPIAISLTTENVLGFEALPLTDRKVIIIWWSQTKKSGAKPVLVKDIFYQILESKDSFTKGSLLFPSPRSIAPKLEGAKTALRAIITEDSSIAVSWINEIAPPETKADPSATLKKIKKIPQDTLKFSSNVPAEKSHSFLHLQKIDTTGRRAWGDLGKPAAPTINCIGQSLATDRTGNIFVGWIESENKQQTILAQRLDRDGTSTWDSVGTAVLQSKGSTKSSLTILSDKKQGLVAVFVESDKLTNAIYGQRVYGERREFGFSMITEIDAQVSNDKIEIDWKVINEATVKSYRLEKYILSSAGDTSWSEIAEVPAKLIKGNNEYRYIYTPDSNGVYFIRVVQVSASGITSTSEITKAAYLKDYGEEVVLLQANPNPCSDSTVIYFYLPSQQDVRFEFYNSRIEEINQFDLTDTFRGKNKLVFNTKDLASGVYFFRFRTGDVLEVKKFVVAH